MKKRTVQYYDEFICNNVILASKESLILDNGKSLNNYNVSYCTYGKLNKNKSNAILIFHPLTADQFVAMENPVTKKKGWWDHLIGKGKNIDTEKYFVICANVLGGCMGTEGPKTINPETGENFGTSFPVLTIRDMVKSQVQLLDYLGISKLLSLIGPSFGGMMALEFAAKYSKRLNSCVLIATSAMSTPLNIGMNEIARKAIMSDPNWHEGKYYKKNNPSLGLSIARMTAHLTYLSEASLARKFGRQLQDKKDYGYSFSSLDFKIESYLRHQGEIFVNRFDANSYLYITQAMDYFDIVKEYDGVLANAYKDSDINFLVISISSDWIHPTKNSMDIVHSLMASGSRVSFTEILSDVGHDEFLLENSKTGSIVEGFLKGLIKR